jgi:hypothetical protein
VSDVVVSPDGAHVYASAHFSRAVAAFARDSLTGALTQLPGTAACVSGLDAACAPARGLYGVESLTIAPDGAFLYTAAALDHAAAVFARNPATGALAQVAGTAGCTSETGSGGGCADGVGLASAYGLAVTADGDHVYVAAPSNDGLALFAHDGAPGGLRQLHVSAACVGETGAGCVDGVALDGVEEVVVSPDGQDVYLAAFGADAVAVLARDAATGALSQPAGLSGCRSETGSGGCADGIGLDGITHVGPAPDGRVTSTRPRRSATPCRRWAAPAEVRRRDGSGRMAAWGARRACGGARQGDREAEGAGAAPAVAVSGAGGITSSWPTVIRLGSAMSLAATIAATVVPYSCAIVDSESPAWIS